MQVRTFNKSIDAFVLSLEESTQAKVYHSLDLLEKFGYNIRAPYSKQITRDIFELRVHGLQEARIFYAFHKNDAILLNVFIKKSQKIPKKEIDLAIRRLRLLDSI